MTNHAGIIKDIVQEIISEFDKDYPNSSIRFGLLGQMNEDILVGVKHYPNQNSCVISFYGQVANSPAPSHKIKNGQSEEVLYKKKQGIYASSSEWSIICPKGTGRSPATA